jgi:hypothetical protein
MAEQGLAGQIKRLVVGEPIPSHLAHHERLSRTTGLAVLSLLFKPHTILTSVPFHLERQS